MDVKKGPIRKRVEQAAGTMSTKGKHCNRGKVLLVGYLKCRQKIIDLIKDKSVIVGSDYYKENVIWSKCTGPDDIAIKFTVISIGRTQRLASVYELVLTMTFIAHEELHSTYSVLTTNNSVYVIAFNATNWIEEKARVLLWYTRDFLSHVL